MQDRSETIPLNRQMKALFQNFMLMVTALCFIAQGTEPNFDVRTKSNVSVETLNQKLKGVLAGKGEHFKKAEEEHKVNAAFLAAIAIVESGNGNSKLARRRLNAFGLKGKSFSKIEESIYYTAALISDKEGFYYGRNKFTIRKIARVYAPSWDAPTNSTWSRQVISIMRELENNS